jgi:hypothetical protein
MVDKIVELVGIPTKGPSPKWLRNFYAPNGEPIKRVWGYHNEPVASYEESFRNVLNGKSIADLIRDQEKPIVIDLMAPPRTVHDLLSNFPKGRGLAVSLPDHQIDGLKPDIQAAYSSNNVLWLQEDVARADTWKSIDKWLENDKAHLIMERAMAGLTYLPVNKNVLGVLVSKVWSRIDSNGGILLLDTPASTRLLDEKIDINSWINSLRASGLDARYDQGDPTSRRPMLQTGKLMVIKTPTSPQILPSI